MSGSVSILDLESISRPREQILAELPPWDEEEAKSRLPKTHKKPETISGWLEEDKANHGKDILEKAALLPEYNQIVIVGYWRDDEVHQFSLDETYSEEDLIHSAMMVIHDAVRSGYLLGWSLTWDVKNIIRKAWMLGVHVPKEVFNPMNRYPLSDRIVDMMPKFQAGDFKAPFTSLDSALRSLKVGQKPDGSEFAKLWAEDKQKALEYNAAELISQAALYRKMGVDL